MKKCHVKYQVISYVLFPTVRAVKLFGFQSLEAGGVPCPVPPLAINAQGSTTLEHCLPHSPGASFPMMESPPRPIALKAPFEVHHWDGI